MSGPRPPIPEPVKRAVRQKCGFGCICCGLPIYEYHHITPYHQCNCHEAENLVLLCPNHHQQVTSGLILDSYVRELASTPVNIARGVSKGLPLHLSGEHVKVWLGDSFFRTQSVPAYLALLLIDDFVVFGVEFDDGNILLNLEIRDNCDRLLLKIKKGELIVYRTSWDFDFRGRRLKLRTELGVVWLDLEIEPPDTIRVHSGLLVRSGIALKVAATGMILLNTGDQLSCIDCVTEDSNGLQLAIALGEADLQVTPIIQRTGINRYCELKFSKALEGGVDWKNAGGDSKATESAS